MPTLRRIWTWSAIAASAAAALIAGAERMTAADQRAQAILAAHAADTSRIVAIGGAVTEILYTLGLEDRIVAVDSTSLYPAHVLKQKRNVGYMRALSAEGILALSPSMIVAVAGAGPKETIAILQSTQVPFISVPDHYSAGGVIERIRMVAAAAGETERGECLSRAVAAEFDALSQLRRGIERPLRVAFVMSEVNERLMVAGGKTAADAILRLAGAQNALTGFDGYKLVNNEAMIAAAPDAVLVMIRSQGNLDPQRLLAHPALAASPAAARNAVVAMEGYYLLGFGPRTAGAARELAAALYPASLAATPDAESRPDFNACAR